MEWRNGRAEGEQAAEGGIGDLARCAKVFVAAGFVTEARDGRLRTGQGPGCDRLRGGFPRESGGWRRRKIPPMAE